MRSKLKPLLDWAGRTNIPVIGIVHLTKDGKNIGGSDVLLKTCRAVIGCDDDKDDDGRKVMTLDESNAAETGAETPYRIKTAQLEDGVSAGVIEWLSGLRRNARQPPSPSPRRPSQRTPRSGCGASSRAGHRSAPPPCRKPPIMSVFRGALCTNSGRTGCSIRSRRQAGARSSGRCARDMKMKTNRWIHLHLHPRLHLHVFIFFISSWPFFILCVRASPSPSSFTLSSQSQPFQ